jgi:uncharacterized Tic20 family protein
MTENPTDQPAEGEQPYSGQPSPGQQPYSGQPAPPLPPPPGQAPAYGQPQAYGQAPAPVSASDARMWAMFAALGGIIVYLIAPLVIYLIYKDRDPFVRRHAAQAVNFQIMILIIEIVSVPLMFVIIGFVTAIGAGVAFYVFSIMAAVAANRGEPYDYPYIPQMIT